MKLLALFGFLIVMGGCGGSWSANRAVIIQPVANMLSKPHHSADVVSQGRLGQTVEILMRREGWWEVKTPDGYTGFVDVHNFRTLPDGVEYPAKDKTSVAISSLRAHLYTTPSVTRQAPLLTAPYECRLELVREKDDRWLMVRLPDDRQAWIQRGDVSPVLEKLEAPQLVEHAKRFIGLPYTWGGTSALGYDCSGFTQMLCRRGGRDIPRDAKPQAMWDGMKPVGRAALETGDLLYFGPSMEKINHTGFYIGDGEFIHSTTNTHPVVQISRLNDEPWTRTFVCARRWKQS